ncbi:MAG: tetratricopeptide repeat protein [Bradyrhizobiaceae bacterium]|nr:tetratricopeptide repeat protein [Bradyrhizobiaceae bacterium]
MARFFRLAVLAVVLSSLASAVSADELKRLYAQILRNPTNSELNFRYAQLAEQRGELRKALSAYERVLVNDPNHPDVHRALQRIRRKLQPDTTQVLAELGAGWESNPRRLNADESDSGLVLARVTVRDERKFGDASRWRTFVQLLGDIYFDSGDLSYGYAGAYTGPVIDVTPTIAMHAALGGGSAYFDHRHFFNEATANLTFESYLEGAFYMVRVRGGYRAYNDFFPSNDGAFADITGKFSFPNVLGEGDVFILTPWLRWSDIGGTGFSLLTPSEQVQPGRFTEYGGKIEYYRRVLEQVSVGGSIAVSRRNYRPTADLAVIPPVEVKRRDLTVVPGATVIFHQVMGYQTDLRADYRFERNNSNLAARDYDNHIATLMLVSRH